MPIIAVWMSCAPVQTEASVTSTAPTQKAGFRVPKTVLWLMEV